MNNCSEALLRTDSFIRRHSLLRSGTIPPELGQLRALEELRLSQNDLEGEIATFWLCQTRATPFHSACACG